jgi:ABC-type uncharacterized transport system substrate-binding protein
MKRREFIMLLGGTATWPLVARAQQPNRVRRIGVLKNTPASDAQAKVEIAAFETELKNLGWREGQNVFIEYRFGAGDASRMAAFAKELVALKPDLLVARSTAAVRPLAAETKTIPIVFIGVSDPVGEGFAASFARPGGNVTGFSNVESAMAGKWVELLKEIAPALKRVIFMFNPETAPMGGDYYARLVRNAADASGVTAIPAPLHSPAEIETVIAAHAREPGSSLLLLPDPFGNTHRAQIIDLAMQLRVPAIFTFSHMAREGGLMAYGVDNVDLYRRSASYVDRILRGERPSDLPIQAPTRFELVINLKTAKALGLTIPPSLLARADEVIE